MRNIALAVLVTTLLAACGSAQAAPNDAAVDAQTQITNVLDSAVAAAKTYGKQHLGHYLDLDVAALRELGLQAPANVSIDVQTDHTSYCMTAINGGADRDDPWRVASVNSMSARVEPGDSCGGR